MYTDGSVVALVAGWGTTPVHEYSDLFLSRDGGATFTRRTTGIDWGISSMLFLNAEQGFVVAGPADNMVYRTADGGRSWQLVLGSSANVDVSYGTPTRTAAGVVVPRATAAGAGITVSLEVTRDAGASFAALAPLPLRIKHFDTLSADLPVTVHGSDVWVASANRIFQTSDSGRTWRTVASAQPVTGIELSTATQAVGLASSECASNTDNCFSTTYLVTTDDGGRTWHPARR